MANRRMEFLIGMTVLVVFITIIVMAVLFGSDRTNLFQFSKQGNKMSILFDKAPGIKNTSRVTKSCIEIGRVYRTDLLDGENGTQVRVFFTLSDAKVRIYSNEQARIKPSLLMGEAEIEFVKNRQYKGEVHELTPNDTIIGFSGSDIMGTVNNIEGDLKDAIQSVNSTAREAAVFIANLNQFMGDENEILEKKQKMAMIFSELGDTLTTTRSLAANMNSILSDQQIRDNIKSGSENFPAILNKVNSLLDNGDDLYKSVKGVVERSHKTFDKLDRSLDNVGDFTEVLSDEGLEFISNMNASGQDIARMVKNISTLSENIVKQIDNKSTPLGMLTDENVGSQIRGIIRNVETGTEKVQPILDDARVFTNKIAHRPSSLIFSRDTYKGSPALGQNGYAYQPYSPGGGITSSLWTQSNSYYSAAQRNNSEYQYDANGDGYEYYPTSMEGLAASHPETYNAIQQQKSCCAFSGKCFLGKSCFGKMKGNTAVPGYVTDQGEYYGYGEMVSDDASYGDGGMVYDAYIPGTMPVADENMMAVPEEHRCGLRGMRFSLTSAFKNVFKRGDADDVTDISAPHRSCLTKGSFCSQAEPIYAAYDSGNDGWTEFGGSTSSSCGLSECAAPQCESIGCGEASPLPGGTSTLPVLQQVSGSPECEEMELTDLSGTGPSTLPPEAEESSQNSNTEVLPPEAIRSSGPQTSYQPSKINPGYAGAAPSSLPAPKSSKKRAFVDDGLPIQFTPNE